MNSEMDTSTSRQSRRYIHGLSREPAPLLPWVGGSETDDLNDSSNDLFDFDFGARDRLRRDVDVGSGAVDYRFADCYDDDAETTSALDNVDLSEVERRLEGALAGFDVPVASPESVSSSRKSVSSAGSKDGGEGGKENECDRECDRECDQECNEECERSSGVWEDGEDFWNNRKRLSTIPGSSPTDAEKARMVQTPRMYSAMRMKRSALSAQSPGLYDGAGFLKT
jgi:hypothetical protein